MTELKIIWEIVSWHAYSTYINYICYDWKIFHMWVTPFPGCDPKLQKLRKGAEYHVFITLCFYEDYPMDYLLQILHDFNLSQNELYLNH